MRTRLRMLALSVLALAVMTVGATGPADAAKKKGKIVADRGAKARAEATKLAHSMVRRKYGPTAAFAARPPYGRVAGISTKHLAGFPVAGRSFLILGNGNVLFADNPNDEPDTSQNAGGPTIRGARDVTIFRINLRVPSKANCLSFRFRFLTEEFPEFVGQQYNDGFIAELDDTTWNTNTIGSPKITAPRNFAYDTHGNLISVNAAGEDTVTAAQAKGTTYDGATRRLRASTPITGGRRHKLYLSIFDQGDRQYDSAVFLDHLTLANNPSCKSGAVP